MLTLSYGYKKPQDGDRGSIWFDALEDDIQRLNDHSHNGIDSAPLSGGSISTGSVVVPAASWGTEYAPGVYRQLITMPLGFSFDNTIPVVKLDPSGHVVGLSIERVGATSFYVYTGFPTESYKVYFK